ncbi:MAG: FAD-binding oxidoreductase [Phycisphaeraceae bacterium]
MTHHARTNATSPVHARHADDVIAAVQHAVRTGVPLVDYGRDHAGLGHPPPATYTRLEREGDVLEHDVRDLVVRADAGCTLGRLQAALAEANQFLPIDADDNLTLAELVDHNVYGPLRVGYGALRDLLLGMSFVDGEGRLVTVGGRTVKNVAGYDVTKLLVGGLGELGVITELTLRTVTIPPATQIVDLEVAEPQQLDDFQTDWLTADAAPAWAVLVFDHGACVVRVGYHGTPSACHAQLRSLETLCDQMTDVRIAATDEYGFDEDSRERAAARAWRPEIPALVKVIVPPASTGFVCQSLALTPTAEPARQLEAYPFHGCIYVGGTLNAEQARRLDAQIVHVIEPVDGLRIWHRRPRGAEDIEPFPPANAQWPVLLRVKRALDPHGILNPGRYLPVQDEPR